MNKNSMFPLFLVLLLAIVGVIGTIFPSYLKGYDTRLKTFSSYEELKDFVNASLQARYPQYPYWSVLQPRSAQLFTEGSLGSSDVPEYSTTNVQVEGVDEADIIKTDGTYIYIIPDNSIKILKAYPPDEAEVLSKIELNGTLKGLFINNDRLAVFEELSPHDMYRYFSTPLGFPYMTRTFIRVYDMADRRNPTLARNVSLDGGYFNSRMIGDYVYAIINEQVYVESQSGDVSLPRIYYDDQIKTLPATQIYYSNVSDRFDTYVNIVAINMLNDLEEHTHKAYLIGWASTMYVSQDNIYITYTSCSSEAQETSIHRIRIENAEIEYEATGEVPGFVLNQFSMDEHNGYFRIATTTGEVWARGEAASKNHVYILDMNLNIVGRIEDLAPGEKIYSARFMGDRGYLVTFKKIDPLFVIDLGNPSDPEVLGQLKITGYSDYLHPYDETHMIGIGKETVEAEEGDFAWYQGVKISLFDVSDVTTPVEMAKYEIGDRGTDSPILSDHKAFLFDKSRNLLVIPVTVAEIDPTKYPGGNPPPYTYGEFVWDGAYVFNISLEGLEFRGGITHLEDDTQLLKSGYYFHSQYSVKRSLYIDDMLYTISNAKIKMNSLIDLSEINEINLTD